MMWIICLVVLLFGFVVFFGAPYVPSKKSDVRRAFDKLYPLGPADTLVDIGSGDGIVLRLAAERGARAVGYELNPLLVLLSRLFSRRHAGVTTHLANFYRADFPAETTVVYVFGDSRDIMKMADKIQETASRVGHPLACISYGFAIPGLAAIKQVGAHYLYEIEPLQADRA